MKHRPFGKHCIPLKADINHGESNDGRNTRNTDIPSSALGKHTKAEGEQTTEGHNRKNGRKVGCKLGAITSEES